MFRVKMFFTYCMELDTHMHSCVPTWKHTFFGEQYIILMPQVHGITLEGQVSF